MNENKERVPVPTMEGWVGSLPVSRQIKNALIDLIGGVRNRNARRAEAAEIQLEKATNGYRQEQENATADLLKVCHAALAQCLDHHQHLHYYARKDALALRIRAAIAKVETGGAP